MKPILLLALTMLLISCQEDDPNRLLRYSMKDGTILHAHEEVYRYEHPDSFLNSESNYVKTPDSVVIKQESTRDSTYGYDEIVSVCWERAQFGNWIEKYGLNKNTTYFVETIYVEKYIQAPKEYAILEGMYKDSDIDSIGVSLNTMKRGFVVSTMHMYGAYKAYTVMKKIAYEENGNAVSVYYPINPSNIKWKYKKILSVW